MADLPLKLSDFMISEKTGVQVENALQKLPSEFEDWNRLAGDFVNLLQRQELREKIKALPVLDHTKLSGHNELTLAHLQLSVLSNGYLWQDNDIPESLPRCLAVPFAGVSSMLGVKPIVSYFSLFLANVCLINPEGTLEFDNINSVVALPGGKEWDGFIRCNTAIELASAPIYPEIIKSLEACKSNNVTALTESLLVIKKTINNMCKTFSKIHEFTTPETFFKVIARMFAGSGPGSPNPAGFLYEGVSDKPMELLGPNAAQTPILQCLDGLFSIQHDEERSQHLELIKSYMLPAHQRFIEEVQRRSKVRQFVESSSDEALKSAFSDCVTALKNFRSYHIQIVTKYIVNMMNMDNTEKTEGPIPFLKGVRDETKP